MMILDSGYTFLGHHVLPLSTYKKWSKWSMKPKD